MVNRRPAAGPPPGLDYAHKILDMATKILLDLQRGKNEMMAGINQLREDIQEIKADTTGLLHLIHPKRPCHQAIGGDCPWAGAG